MRRIEAQVVAPDGSLYVFSTGGSVYPVVMRRAALGGRFHAESLPAPPASGAWMVAATAAANGDLIVVESVERAGQPISENPVALAASVRSHRTGRWGAWHRLKASSGYSFVRATVTAAGRFAVTWTSGSSRSARAERDPTGAWTWSDLGVVWLTDVLETPRGPYLIGEAELGGTDQHPVLTVAAPFTPDAPWAPVPLGDWSGGPLAAAVLPGGNVLAAASPVAPGASDPHMLLALESGGAGAWTRGSAIGDQTLHIWPVRMLSTATGTIVAYVRGTPTGSAEIVEIELDGIGLVKAGPTVLGIAPGAGNPYLTILDLAVADNGRGETVVAWGTVGSTDGRQRVYSLHGRTLTGTWSAASLIPTPRRGIPYFDSALSLAAFPDGDFVATWLGHGRTSSRPVPQHGCTRRAS